MVLVSSNIQIDHSTLGTSPNRSVCDQPKQETPNLRVSHSRSSGMGGGCTEHLLEKHSRLRLFPDSIVTQNGPEVTVSRVQAHPDSPGLWFWDLVELSLDHPRQLPPIRSLLKQPLNNQFYSHPESLNLHAWYLGVQSSRTKVPLQKWQIELLHLKDTLPEPSTHQNGQFFNVGASKNRWT